MIDLDGRRFTLVSNTAGDAKPGETIFSFEQQDRAVRVRYAGGGVKLGAMVGLWEEDGSLTVWFQQVTIAGKLCGGDAKIRVETDSDGRLRFIDDWRFTINGEGAGQAIWTEI